MGIVRLWFSRGKMKTNPPAVMARARLVEPHPSAVICSQCGGETFYAVFSYGIAELKLRCSKCNHCNTYFFPAYLNDYQPKGNDSTIGVNDHRSTG